MERKSIGCVAIYVNNYPNKNIAIIQEIFSIDSIYTINDARQNLLKYAKKVSTTEGVFYDNLETYYPPQSLVKVEVYPFEGFKETSEYIKQKNGES